MRLVTAGAAAVAGAVLAGVVAAAPAPTTMKFNMATTTDAQGMHVNVAAKIWVKGQKARVEADDPRTGPLLVLVDGPQIRTLFRQRKQGTLSTIRVGKNGPKNSWEFVMASVDQLTHGAKKLSAQSVDGYPCDVYELTHSTPGSTMTVKSWITQDTQPRMPLKVEKKIRVMRPNVTINQSETTRITALRFGSPIPDSLFAVPPGYKIVEAGAPGLPGMGRPGPRP